MQIISTKAPPIPLPPRLPDVDPLLHTYLQQLANEVTQAFSRLHGDITLGRVRRSIFSTIPVLADLEEGQAVIVDLGTSKRVYYRANNQLFFNECEVGVSPSGYDTIQEEGVALPQRTILNFIGASTTATDDPTNNRTNVTKAIGYDTIREESTDLPQRTTLQFAGTTVTAEDFSARTRVTVLGPAGVIPNVQYHTTGAVWGANTGFSFHTARGRKELAVGGFTLGVDATGFAYSTASTPVDQITFGTPSTILAINAQQVVWSPPAPVGLIGSNRYAVVIVTAFNNLGESGVPTSVVGKFPTTRSFVLATSRAGSLHTISIWAVPCVSDSFSAGSTVTVTFGTVMQDVHCCVLYLANVVQAQPESSMITSTSSSLQFPSAGPPLGLVGSLAISGAVCADGTKTDFHAARRGSRDITLYAVATVDGAFRCAGALQQRDFVGGQGDSSFFQYSPTSPLTLGMSVSIAIQGIRSSVNSAVSTLPNYPDLGGGSGTHLPVGLWIDHAGSWGPTIFGVGRFWGLGATRETQLDLDPPQIFRYKRDNGSTRGSLHGSTRRRPRAGLTRMNWMTRTTSEGTVHVTAAWAPAGTTPVLGVTDFGIDVDASPPILFDAATSFAGTGGLTLSWTHTVGTGSNRILIVSAGQVNNGGSSEAAITGITYAGQTLTKAVGTEYPSISPAGSEDPRNCEMWYLLNPPSGTDTIVITYDNTQDARYGAGISLSNVKQQGPEATSFKRSGSQNVETVIKTVSNNAWVVDALIERSSTTEYAVFREFGYAVLGGSLSLGDWYPYSMLSVHGGLSTWVRTVTSDYECSRMSDSYLLVDATAGAVTITLPPATALGLFLHIKKSDNTTNVVTIRRSPVTSDTIQGASTITLSSRYESVTLYADGTATWYKTVDGTTGTVTVGSIEITEGTNFVFDEDELVAYEDDVVFV